jgi:hypothetical protein
VKSAENKAWVAQWNVQSLTKENGKRNNINSYINELKPLLMVLNETREAGVTFHGYKHAEAKPAEGRNKKLNAIILIDERIAFEERAKEINYVSVLITDQLLGPPTLVSGIYCNPDKKFSEDRELAECKMEEDIEQFRKDFPNGNVICAGDFNITPAEMEE